MSESRLHRAEKSAPRRRKNAPRRHARLSERDRTRRLHGAEKRPFPHGARFDGKNRPLRHRRRQGIKRPDARRNAEIHRLYRKRRFRRVKSGTNLKQQIANRRNRARKSFRGSGKGEKRFGERRIIARRGIVYYQSGLCLLLPMGIMYVEKIIFLEIIIW